MLWNKVGGQKQTLQHSKYLAPDLQKDLCSSLLLHNSFRNVYKPWTEWQYQLSVAFILLLFVPFSLFRNLELRIPMDLWCCSDNILLCRFECNEFFPIQINSRFVANSLREDLHIMIRTQRHENWEKQNSLLFSLLNV